jgi:hypothetical protein
MEFGRKKSYKCTKVGLFSRKSPTFGVCLAGRDTQQNSFTYNFGVLMNPIKKNHRERSIGFREFPSSNTHTAAQYMLLIHKTRDFIRQETPDGISRYPVRVVPQISGCTRG